MIRFLLFSLCLFVSFPVYAGNEDTSKAEYLIGKGTNLYVEGEYQKALELFLEASKQRKNGYLFYNIGNCYYRLGQKGEALAAYRKAERYIPDMPELRKNIHFLLKKRDPALEKPETFPYAGYFIPLYHKLSLDTIAFVVLVLLSMTALFSLLYLYRGKRQFFWLSWFFGLLMLLMGASFSLHYYERGFLHFGVIISENAEVKSERTDEAITLFTLPELAEFRVLAQTGGWVKITVKDGRTGWVSLKTARVW